MVFLTLGLHSHHNIAVHLHETTVRVPCETGIAATFGYAFHRLVVKAEVKYGVHHAGHRYASTRAYRYEQGIGSAAELRAHNVFYLLDSLFHIRLAQVDHLLFAELEIFGTNIGCYSETGRHGDADKIHLREVGTFTAEQLFHLAVTFGLFVAERVDTFYV